VKTETPGNYKLLKRLEFGLRRIDRKVRLHPFRGIGRADFFWGVLSQVLSQKWKENTLFFPFLSPLGLRKTAGEMEWFGSSFHNFRLARTPEEKPRVIRDISHPVPLETILLSICLEHQKNDRRYPGKLKEREGMSK
jgi:hypothetical protein